MNPSKTSNLEPKNVRLTRRQHDALRVLAFGKNISVTEYIRRLIDEHIDSVEIRNLLIKLKTDMN